MVHQAPLRFLGSCIFCILLAGCGRGNSVEQQEDMSRDQEIPGNVAPATGEADGTDDLLQAALDGRADEVHLILQSGTDVNGMDDEGHTALMFAAFNGHYSIVQELLKRGAGLEQRDVVGRTALLYAATGPFPETVKMLLEHGADPNLADSGEHFTPLMHAAAEGHMEVVSILLEYGADPSLKDVDGDNAESFARQAGHDQVADYLAGLH
ncbi:MAG: ankyrin repeat domain-containing protein [Bacteroidales bacterium]